MSDSKGANTKGNTKKKRTLPEPLRENLWKPGQSGNPSGRPKKKWLTEVTEELLEEMLSDPEQREVFKEAMKQKLLSQRVVGAMTLDKVWERTEGKVAQAVEVSGPEGGPISISEVVRKVRERKSAYEESKE